MDYNQNASKNWNLRIKKSQKKREKKELFSRFTLKH